MVGAPEAEDIQANNQQLLVSSSLHAKARMSNAARQAKRAGASESSGNGTTAGLPCLLVLEPSEKAIKEIFASKKDHERCRREVTCRHAVILKREIKTLQKTFVANGIRDKTLNPFSLDPKSVVYVFLLRLYVLPRVNQIER